MKKALSSVCPDNYVQKCYNAFVCSVCHGSVCFLPCKMHGYSTCLKLLRGTNRTRSLRISFSSFCTSFVLEALLQKEDKRDEAFQNHSDI